MGLQSFIDLKASKFIYYAGKEWHSFDFDLGMKALFNFENPEYIFYSGSHWKSFNFAKGLDILIKTESFEYIFRAGTLWEEFDYNSGWQALESNVQLGRKWRGEALDNFLWKGALREIFKTYIKK